MTTTTTPPADLLPLPEPSPEYRFGQPVAASRYTCDDMRAYATRCVAHALAPVVAERDALRKDALTLADKFADATIRAEVAAAENVELREMLRDCRGGKPS